MSASLPVITPSLRAGFGAAIQGGMDCACGRWIAMPQGRLAMTRTWSP